MALWAEEDDPRVTRVGKILRRLKLDEIPQFWNVLRGEMSLVGPRPERPEIVENLQQVIPFYRLRHVVRPGLTGWAAVRFPYGRSVRDALVKLQYDLYYLKHQSLTLDALILFKTLGAILTPPRG
jgi:lipopolysaccharide/colanic/teichoic acid biosynthesis glycosyltransferase